MGLLTTLQDEMKTAMKAQDRARLDALRLIVSAIRYVEVDTPNLSDEQILSVLTKEAKKRREAIEAYTAAGRTEAAEKEQYELGIIQEYLPKMLSEDEVRAKVAAAFEGKQLDNFGLAMGIAMASVKGQADGSLVSKIVKELFQK